MRDIHYFDNAATTRVDEAIGMIVSKYNSCDFFNPSANYIDAVELHNCVESARLNLLNALKAYGYKLIFLSSGSEGDNLALFGTRKRKNTNIVISGAEHPAVYNAAMHVKTLGYDVRLCPVNDRGVISTEDLLKMVDGDTLLVSVMHVNNETGGVNDIKGLVKSVKSQYPNVLFHSDGVQALGKVPVALCELGADLYTISGHKIGAPKGIAALIIREGINLTPMIFGGGQESGIRSSTENVSGIMALEACVGRALKELPANTEKYRSFRAIIENALREIADLRILTGEKDAPHIFTFAFKDVRGEVLQHSLEAEGYLVGTGSACSARRSHDRIPKALGLGAYSDGIIRVSFGRENTVDEVRLLAEKLVSHYQALKKYIG